MLYVLTVNPQGGSIDCQLIEVEICRWGGRGGGQLTANSERIWRECWSLGVDQQPTQRGSAESVDPWGFNWQPTQRGSTANSERIHRQLREDLQRECWSLGVHQHPTQRGSAANSERICRECWSLGRGWSTASSERIHSQLREDLHSVDPGGQSTAYSERIHGQLREDPHSVDPGGSLCSLTFHVKHRLATSLL